jgi:hypothetical protein
MQGAYGGLIIVVLYAFGGGIPPTDDLFLYLDGTPFTLLSGENLKLL